MYTSEKPRLDNPVDNSPFMHLHTHTTLRPTEQAPNNLMYYVQ